MIKPITPDGRAKLLKLIELYGPEACIGVIKAANSPKRGRPTKSHLGSASELALVVNHLEAAYSIEAKYNPAITHPHALAMRMTWEGERQAGSGASYASFKRYVRQGRAKARASVADKK